MELSPYLRFHYIISCNTYFMWWVLCLYPLILEGTEKQRFFTNFHRIAQVLKLWDYILLAFNTF